ncbi:MAG: hypothetical protein OHK006_22710 [Thermodesulfovibrionales bacterium]
MLITLGRALQYLERFEQKAELFYRRLAGIFAENGSTALVFARLADQEKAHRDLILFQMRILKGSEELFSRIEFNVNEMLVAADEIDRAMTRNEISLEEAVALCRRMEESYCESHLKLAALKIEGEMLKLVENLAADDKAHIALLDGLRNPARNQGS